MSSTSSEDRTYSKFLFAARRIYNRDGTTALYLVAPKTRDMYCVNERTLMEKNVFLGDFAFARTQNNNLLTQTIKKTEHKKKYNVTKVGNVAYIENVKGNIIPAKDKLAFTSEDFGNALVNADVHRGEYTVRISLLKHAPVEVSRDCKFFLEATNLLPKNNQNEHVTIGVGFEEEAPRSPVRGAGFSEVPVQNPTLKAVVLSVMEKNGVRTHFLWILDKQAEGRLVDANHQCEKGHFFEGTFKEKHGKWECVKYLKPVTQKDGSKLVDGGLENGRLFFKVKITEFKAPGFNQKYFQAKAQYFDEILDTECHLSSNCVGYHVKIQRRSVGDKEFAWVVMEVL